MSDVDSKPTLAEHRLAAYGRDALADAKASGRIDRLVESIAASAAAAAAPPTPTPAPKPAAGNTWPLAVGTAVLAGAVAFGWFGTREATSEPAPPPATMTTSPSPTAGPHEPATAASSSPGVAVTSLPDAVEAKPVASATASTAREPSRTRSPDAHGATNAAPEVYEDAALMFERANTARRNEDHPAAEKLYRRLIDAHPTTREAMTSRVILGRMQLARGAAADALVSFDAYLAGTPHGTLEEQALIGRAQSLQALGRRTEERAAWRVLLERFPNTASRRTAPSTRNRASCRTALERAADAP